MFHVLWRLTTFQTRIVEKYSGQRLSFWWTSIYSFLFWVITDQLCHSSWRIADLQISLPCKNKKETGWSFYLHHVSLITQITFSLTNFFIFFFYRNQKLTHFYCLLFICDNQVDFDILFLLVSSTSVICFFIYCKQPRPKRTRGKKEKEKKDGRW